MKAAGGEGLGVSMGLPQFPVKAPAASCWGHWSLAGVGTLGTGWWHMGVSAHPARELLAAPAGAEGGFWEFLLQQGPFPQGQWEEELWGCWLCPAALGMGCVHQHTPPGLCCVPLPLFFSKRHRRVILLLCRLSRSPV